MASCQPYLSQPSQVLFAEEHFDDDNNHQCWANILDVRPTLNQHWNIVTG